MEQNIQILILMESNAPEYNTQPNLGTYSFFKLIPGITVYLNYSFLTETAHSYCLP